MLESSEPAIRANESRVTSPQRVLLARSYSKGGFCGRCYAQRQPDRAYFSGLRELVLIRDHRSCQVCHQPDSAKRTLAVHDRKTGTSRKPLLITLCPAYHARAHKLTVVRRPLALLLLELWRGQHPRRVDQPFLDFAAKTPEQQIRLAA